MASTRKEAPGQEREEKQGGKVYSKMLSKDAAAALAVPSFRVYYGVASAGSVPFLWESQPGTPKSSPSAAGALQPPLTPPPSYYAAAGKNQGRGGGGGSYSGTRWLAFLRRKRRTSSPCSSSSSSAASWSSSSTASMSPVFTVQSSPAQRGHRRAFSACDEMEAAAAAECERRRRGCGVAVAVRNALATVVGRRATSAAA
ncbi:uncharacterized protein LOC100826757 [Brachypodium distachyon]|uniref:Uncharacterized protein n=1 Tax=Brachypodium distachyon TaxID=15368 RepID=I1HLF4_BRADI|nr:uncharacterized protein LOC100826757 [Brachypodium distachyon]KQK07316.1 hypothetical protein BRADI_2g34507v3 [Brachypodium distachyon]|eukprot:XP_003568850.1 uncharacterized protein LOC100826757 [Brachypodium distachyon]